MTPTINSFQQINSEHGIQKTGMSGVTNLLNSQRGAMTSLMNGGGQLNTGGASSIMYPGQQQISQQSPSERFRRNLGGKKTHEIQNGFQFEVNDKGQLTQTNSSDVANFSGKIRNAGSLSPTRKLV